jgi:hypothetical protein
MNWDALGAIAELIGAIAVVVSIVYLATQIRLSNTLALTQTRRDMLHAVQQELYKIVDYPEIFDAFHKETLTREEKIRLNEWLIADLRGREFEWMQHRDGSIDQGTFESYKAAVTVNLGTPRTRNWWQVNRPLFDPKFAEFVDSVIRETPLTEFFANLDKWD